MTAGTHLAGAALTASVLRGLGLELGPAEYLALGWGAVLPDLDTTTSGPGKFARPLSAWLVRAPVAGRVAEAQLQEVRPEGLTVEVVLVEKPQPSATSSPTHSRTNRPFSTLQRSERGGASGEGAR